MSAAATPLPAAPSDDAPHLLVVDDDRRIRDLLSRFLRGEGYRVTTADGSQSAACTVQVATPLPPEPPKEKLGLRSIYQDKGETINEFSAKVGSTVQMRVDGTEQTVTWTIEDTKIATVDANGLVTAVAKGKTILKATVGDQSVSCFVIVN